MYFCPDGIREKAGVLLSGTGMASRGGPALPRAWRPICAGLMAARCQPV
jgi:hypothetical protein